MRYGWSGGQFSGARALVGALLAALFVRRLLRAVGGAEGPSALPLALAGLGFLAAVALLLGWQSRLAGLFAAALLGAAAIAPMGWWRPEEVAFAAVVVLVAAAPPAPYGSFAARGRVDPGGGWALPAILVQAARLLLVVAALSLAVGRLGGDLPPSLSWLAPAGSRALPGWPRGVGEGLYWTTLVGELGVAPSAFLHRLRPWWWLGNLALHLPVFLVAGSAEAVAALVVLHLLCFEPARLPPRRSPELLFYDGDCGLCHRAVRFLLAEAPDDAALRFAPLGGATFAQRVPVESRDGLPDSMVLLTGEGALLTRSGAALHLADRLGGAWRLLAWGGRLLPRQLLDLGYDLVARVRKRVFAPPPGICPILPPALRGRFDP